MPPDSVPTGDPDPERGRPLAPPEDHAGGTSELPAEPSWIAIEEFSRLDLRVARVAAAERHPKADRLLKLQVELGGETRQIVASIAGSYAPEELLGRLIVVVANLKPARLRGEVSQGMLLAASDGEVISILSPDRPVPPGAQVH